MEKWITKVFISGQWLNTSRRIFNFFFNHPDVCSVYCKACGRKISALWATQLLKMQQPHFSFFIPLMNVNDFRNRAAWAMKQKLPVILTSRENICHKHTNNSFICKCYIFMFFVLWDFRIQDILRVSRRQWSLNLPSWDWNLDVTLNTSLLLKVCPNSTLIGLNLERSVLCGFELLEHWNVKCIFYPLFMIHAVLSQIIYIIHTFFTNWMFLCISSILHLYATLRW